jgi:hypothetical protein
VRNIGDDLSRLLAPLLDRRKSFARRVPILSSGRS